MSYPKRSEIWWVSFEPQVGTEINKTRPALIVSNNFNNEHNTKVTLLPITGAENKRQPPLTVKLPANQENQLQKDSYIKIPDITTFDKSRLQNKIGDVNQDIMHDVDRIIKTHLHLGL